MEEGAFRFFLAWFFCKNSYLSRRGILSIENTEMMNCANCNINPKSPLYWRVMQKIRSVCTLYERVNISCRERARFIQMFVVGTMLLPIKIIYKQEVPAGLDLPVKHFL